MHGRPMFRLVGVEQTSEYGTLFTLLTGDDGSFCESVEVRVECRPRENSSAEALAYVLDDCGPRGARSSIERHACSVARWLAVGHGAPA